MWMEGVWEIVRARQSKTKFIVSDNPVTFYCKSTFPSDWLYPNDCNLKQIGTRTLFPLGPDSCLIITHLQLARNPKATPTETGRTRVTMTRLSNTLARYSSAANLRRPTLSGLTIFSRSVQPAISRQPRRSGCIPSGMCPRLTGGCL